MRFTKWPQLPGAGRARVGHHQGSHTTTSPEAVLLSKMAYHTKQICRQCTVHVALPKLDQQSRQQALRAYCPNIYTVPKGFKCSGVEGQDVVALLKKAIDKRDDIKVDVAAILNDTTGKILS